MTRLTRPDFGRIKKNSMRHYQRKHFCLFNLHFGSYLSSLHYRSHFRYSFKRREAGLVILGRKSSYLRVGFHILLLHACVFKTRMFTITRLIIQRKGVNLAFCELNLALRYKYSTSRYRLRGTGIP